MTISVQGKSEMQARGHRTHGCCKPVICIDTGEVYASLSDCAEREGVALANISQVISGKHKTCNGKRYCLVSKVTEHLDDITASIRAREAKANAYEELERQKYALVNAEENVRKLAASCSAMRAKYEAEIDKLNKAKQEMYALASRMEELK